MRWIHISPMVWWLCDVMVSACLNVSVPASFTLGLLCHSWPPSHWVLVTKGDKTFHSIPCPSPSLSSVPRFHGYCWLWQSLMSFMREIRYIQYGPCAFLLSLPPPLIQYIRTENQTFQIVTLYPAGPTAEHADHWTPSLCRSATWTQQFTAALGTHSEQIIYTPYWHVNDLIAPTCNVCIILWSHGGFVQVCLFKADGKAKSNMGLSMYWHFTEPPPKKHTRDRNMLL